MNKPTEQPFHIKSIGDFKCLSLRLTYSANRVTQACITLCILMSPPLLASGVAPYLPINSSPALDNEIERLVAVSNMPNLSKPYNLATIYAYLEKISDSHPTLYMRINRALVNYEKKIGLTYKKLSLSTNSNNHLKPNSNGVTTEQHYQSILRGQWQVSDNFGIYAGANITDDEYEYSGSTISLGTSSAQLDIGFKEHWFGPFNGSAHLISNNAQTMPSISLSNNLPIMIYRGAINYDLFVAQMSTQDVAYDGEVSDKRNPYLTGAHLSLQPINFLTIAVNRTYQFSGGERPFSFNDVIHAFTEPDEPIINDSNTEEASGELLESMSSRLNIQSKIPFSLKFEYATKKNHKGNTSLNKNATTAGVYFPYLFKDMISLNYEYAKWQEGWHKNTTSPYSLGYSNKEILLGYWPEQIQLTDNSTAGTSHFVNLVTQFTNSHILTTTIRTIQNNNNTEDVLNERLSDDSWQLQLSYSIPFQAKTLSLEGYAGSNQIGEKYSQLGVSLQW